MAKDTRSRMLDVAADLLQDRGYHGLALADLLAQSKAPRGSLYFHFPSGKDQLVATATRDGIDAVTESLRAGLAAESSPGRAVRRLLEASAAALAASDFRFGSPTAPLVLDGLAAGSEIAALAHGAYDSWIELFEASLIAAGLPARRAQSLATIIEASFEGLLIVCRAKRDTAPMLAGARELEELIEGALGARSNRRGKKS